LLPGITEERKIKVIYPLKLKQTMKGNRLLKLEFSQALTFLYISWCDFLKHIYNCSHFSHLIHDVKDFLQTLEVCYPDER